mmetsp:Transcript_32853/g.60574  ORF Transcript_32853/g.60574 Transcript_32853/m.60574 type:complete len:431 (+) Transcript_32853:19-1311(+)|eukprot:CAMPEP_0196133280 /NCGR_PEP_ID=MMETSP0910-20130528/2566_1 /TAXON_ID=49265 /ORGANISM="Thalassiosira rotula, Strain GSO102" /LENGTH=430 /DNA_ID=CAMNT_0041392989 /DNA_START=15 /DNA_END=1307 /DNA_ORIENTATION=-
MVIINKASSALIYLTLQLGTVRSMTTTARFSVTEKIYSCSDGVKLAARHWTNFDTSSNTHEESRHTRKILCLHGWLDNAASFNRLAPFLMESFSSPSGANAATIPTEIVALDFPGHGLSGHKSVDGPPQLLAEYVYYVAELVEALQWGKGNAGGAGVGVSRSVVGNINANSNNSGSKEIVEKQTINKIDTSVENDNHKIFLIGHSMGSGVSVLACAAFPEWFSSLVILEGGLVARDANDASRHVRAACQRRLKSNRTLFPKSNTNSGATGETVLPRAKIYSNLEQAIEARLSTTRRMPGDQFLSFEAARDMVVRATAPASKVASSTSRQVDSEAVVFRHDPRLQWPSLQYYTREQVEAFFRDVNTSNIPVCFLWAADGWPVDAWAERIVNDVLKPTILKKLSGSHHFHADPDSVEAVANEIIMFAEEQKL